MMFKKEKKLNIDLGLKDLNLDFDLFPKDKSQKVPRFPKPKPHYTAKGKPFMTQKEKEILARKSKKVVKSTGSAFNSILKKIKNRKINKLEKEHFKQKEKADTLAHEIKLRLSLEDSNNDIARYEKELEIMNRPKEKEHTENCNAYRDLVDNKCICGADE